MIYTNLDAPELLEACGDSADKWAEACAQHAKKQGLPDIDQHWLMGWFANAIEHSHDIRTGCGPVVLPDGSAFFGGTIQ